MFLFLKYGSNGSKACASRSLSSDRVGRNCLTTTRQRLSADARARGGVGARIARIAQSQIIKTMANARGSTEYSHHSVSNRSRYLMK